MSTAGSSSARINFDVGTTIVVGPLDSRGVLNGWEHQSSTGLIELNESNLDWSELVDTILNRKIDDISFPITASEFLSLFSIGEVFVVDIVNYDSTTRN